MRIEALEIDGFGVWRGLRLDELPPGLSVFYGPNEAGKTTLLEFIRSVLHGFSAERRRYLPAPSEGLSGGALGVGTAAGRFTVRRRDDPTRLEPLGAVTIEAADGSPRGDHVLKSLLSGIDEVVYNNIFAIGLQELQELATLSDTEAADLLYSLTCGVDRISLVDVMRELRGSRARILSATGEPCLVTQAMAERDRLRAEIEELADEGRRYGRLVAERDRIDRETTELEQASKETEHRARVVDLALALRPRWQRRAEIDSQLAPLAGLKPLPENALKQIDDLNAQFQEERRRADDAKAQHELLREQLSALPLNRGLWKQAARIEVLKEQQDWVGALQTQIAEYQREIAQWRGQLAAEQERLGFGPKGSATLPAISSKTLLALRTPARNLRRGERRLQEAQEDAGRTQAAVEKLGAAVKAGMSERGEPELAVAVERAGNLVAQLRRRVELDQRLEGMARNQLEIEEEVRNLFDQQLLPVWALFGIGAGFVIGVVFVLVSLVFPQSVTGSVGWTLSLLGLTGTIAIGITKSVVERANTVRLSEAQQQLNMLQLQNKQACEERDALDQQLPRGGGPMTLRLDAAQRELDRLQELVPLESEQRAAEQEADSTGQRLAEAEAQLADARKRWRDALVKARLPDGLTTLQVRRMASRWDSISQLHRRIAQREEELQRRQREFESLAARIEELVEETKLPVKTSEPNECIRLLAANLAEEEVRSEQRRALRLQTRKLRRHWIKLERAVRRIDAQRRGLFKEAGVATEAGLRETARRHATAQGLRQQREALQREIEAALGEFSTEDEIRAQIEGHPAHKLEQLRDELLQRMETLDRELKERFERRGQLAEQIKLLADDRRLARKHLELGMVETRLRQSMNQWKTLAATERVLDGLRANYERDRQPETLQEASGLFEQFTRGRYRRIWTPLGDETLLIDDTAGATHPVERLSRGTREQLFLALRLALAASYFRHGTQLPMVLDDVLVNFDVERAKAAAAVLRDFAEAGRQVFLFTCHEHVMKIFRALNVPTSELPSAEGNGRLVSVKKASRPAPEPEPKPMPVIEAPPTSETDEFDEELDEDYEVYEWQEAANGDFEVDEEGSIPRAADSVEVG